MDIPTRETCVLNPCKDVSSLQYHKDHRAVQSIDSAARPVPVSPAALSPGWWLLMTGPCDG